MVGLGASAGGPETLEAFLKNVPPPGRRALAIIQHLDPTHKGVMPERLPRGTTLQGVQVRPDCVQVIPPNKDMSIVRKLGRQRHVQAGDAASKEPP